MYASDAAVEYGSMPPEVARSAANRECVAAVRWKLIRGCKHPVARHDPPVRRRRTAAD